MLLTLCITLLALGDELARDNLDATGVNVILLIWFACLGGSFGSFMNVVVYRLPRGKSLISPGSACPQCGHAIRMRHNLPVLGWLILRGRCYDCGSRIPLRYPLIEAIMATTFLILAWTGPISLAGNLPVAQNNYETTTHLLWWHAAYMMLLFSATLCLVLIEYDARPDDKTHCPRSVFFGPAAAGLLLPLFVPRLHPVPFASLPPQTLATLWIGPLVDGLAGAAAAGVLLAASYGTLGLGRQGRQGRTYPVAVGLLVGVYLGWQAAYVLLAAASVVYLLRSIAAPYSKIARQVTWSMVLWILALALVPAWADWYRALPPLGSWPAAQLGISLVAATAIAYVSSWLTVKARSRIGRTKS